MKPKGHRCPFLREVQVKSCQASAYRKVIPRSTEGNTGERCSSAEYVTCPVAHEHNEEHPQHTRCPFLHESLVQYCGAASSPKYIPYSESMITRCGTANHAYCEQFLTYAHPGSGSDGDTGDESVGGIRFRTDRAYTPNHMWIDANPDGSCHIGVDSFFTSIVGKVEMVTFAAAEWDGRPAVVIRACGSNMPMVFPAVLQGLSSNTSLRLHPDWVTEHPFTLGWLYEARSVPSDGETILIDGALSAGMMRKDMDHLIRHVSRNALKPYREDHITMADGGVLCFEEIHRIAGQEMMYLYNEFFSPSRRFPGRT